MRNSYICGFDMEKQPSCLKQFNIAFSGLKDGRHVYEFNIDKTFFEHFELGEFETSEITLDFYLEKSPTMLTLDFKGYGAVKVACDRCTEPVEVPVDFDKTIYIKFGEETTKNNADDIVVIPETAHEINIAHFIYEFIHLALPLKRVHKKGRCNPEVIRKLEELSLKNEVDIDPRWNKLKNLYNNNK